MKKNKLLTSTAIAGLVLPLSMTAAQSDSANFSGGFLSLGGSVNETDADIKGNAVTLPVEQSAATSAAVAADFLGFRTSTTTNIGRLAKSLTDSESDVNGEISLGYNFPVNDKFLLGLDITASTADKDHVMKNDYTQGTISTQCATVDASLVVSVATGEQTTTYSEEETYSIGIRPSYAINDKTMAYSRLSYGQTKATLKTAYSIAADQTANKSKTEDLDTYGLNIGVIHNLNEKAFVDVSLNYRKTDKISQKIDDSGTTSAIGDTVATLSTATNTLESSAEAESYGLGIKVGVKF